MAAGADEADVVDKPGEAEVHEAEEAEADEADNANDAVEAVEAVEAKADEANNAVEAVEADEVDKAVATNDTANEAIVLDEAGNKLGELLMAVGVLILVFSLTKYSVIFTEVEGDFAKDINNQLK